jgi:uncharacterized protein
MNELDLATATRLLGLEPHPTCGFVAETYRVMAGEAATGASGRAIADGSALYFAVTPDARMVLHRIQSDQLYHHYAGAPLEVLLLRPDGSGEVATVGPDLASGQRPQLLIPARTFHVSRLAGAGTFALLGTTAWPAVRPGDAEFATADALVERFPGLAAEIRAFARFPPPAQPPANFR